MILNGIFESECQSNFNHFRFMDLTAEAGGATPNRAVITDYIRANQHDILQYFVSEDEDFGLHPHIIVVLGNLAYELFYKHLRADVVKRNPELMWIQMPHPSAQTVHNESLHSACKEINQHLNPINLGADKWFCKGQNENGWLRL